jgi:hypothetical protein
MKNRDFLFLLMVILFAIGSLDLGVAHAAGADGAVSTIWVNAPSGSAGPGVGAAPSTSSGLMALLLWATMLGAVLTAPFDAPQRDGEFVFIPVEANTQLYSGGIIARDAAGNAVAAQDAAGLRVVGRCEEGVDNNSAQWNNFTYGAAGAVSVRVRRGIFAYNISAIDPLGATDIGNLAYIESDSVVNKNGGVNKVIAGRLIDIDAVTGAAWVDFRDHAVNIN